MTPRISGIKFEVNNRAGIKYLAINELYGTTTGGEDTTTLEDEVTILTIVFGSTEAVMSVSYGLD